MKKTATVVLILMALTTSFVRSQSLSKGVKAGVNISTFGGADAPSDLKSLTAFSAGVFFNLSLPGPISIQPEVLYSQKGAKSTSSSYTSSINLTYIEIPILLKFNIPLAPAAPVKPNVFAGPAAGFLITAKAKIDPAPPAPFPAETDIKDEFTNMDLGVVMGVGLDIDLVAVQLTIDARYFLGLNTLDKNEDPTTHTKEDVKNRTASVNIGIAL